MPKIFLITLLLFGCSSLSITPPAFDQSNRAITDYYYQIIAETIAANPHCIEQDQLSNKAKLLMTGDIRKNVRAAAWADEVEDLIAAWDDDDDRCILE